MSSTVLELFLGLVAIVGAILAVKTGIEAELLTVGGRVPVPAAAFLEDSVDELILESYDKVADLKRNGSSLAKMADDGRYRVDLAISHADRSDLYQIEAILLDASTGKEVDRIVTYRSRLRPR